MDGDRHYGVSLVIGRALTREESWRLYEALSNAIPNDLDDDVSVWHDDDVMDYDEDEDDD